MEVRARAFKAVRQIADRAAVLKSGVLVEIEETERFDAPAHPYSIDLLRLTPSPDHLEDMDLSAGTDEKGVAPSS